MNQNQEDIEKKSEVIPRKFLSLNEAKVYLHISKVTLWRWNKTGKLPVSHIGGRAWVRISDLDNLIEKGFLNGGL